jgi:ABC-type lipoprotein release transport system permease subunit
MKALKQSATQNFKNFRVGLLLAFRQIQRASIWLNVLVVVIMTLTFLNLVVITGVLVGLIEGSLVANREQYTGDVFISAFTNDPSIEQTPTFRRTLASLDEVVAFSTRYREGGQIEANYRERRDFNEEPNLVNTTVVGINPDDEDATTALSTRLVDGEYLDEGESGYVLLGATILDEYSDFSDIFEPLQNTRPGSKVRIRVNSATNLSDSAIDSGGEFAPDATRVSGGRTIEFTVKGVVDTKVGEVSSAAYITESDWRRLVGRPNTNANQIAVVSRTPDEATTIVSALRSAGLDDVAEIERADEAIPSFLNDIQITFGLLGNVIGAVSIVVSAITIFVVIYINALTRRKYIGILKGIGINRKVIRTAYVLQAIFYAIIGIGIASLIIYFVLVPFIDANPINFPFSDGILVAEPLGTAIRAGILMIVTAAAGFLPAWLIVRQNTLDAILGR